MRSRTLAGLVVGVLTVAGLLAAPAAAHQLAAAPIPDAAAPAPMPGTYVSLGSPSRVVDTRTGAAHNRRGALRAGQEFTATIAGRGRVPSRGVGSVLITVSALQPTGPGGLTVYGGSRRPGTTSLQFATGRSATDSAVVALSSGRLTVNNTARRGSTQVVIDVLGYYRAGAAPSGEPGIYHAINPRRLVDTRNGTGLHARGPLRANQRITPKLAGIGQGVPSDAGAVAVTITAVGASAPGSIVAAGGGDPGATLPTVRFAKGESVSGFTVLGLGSRAISLTNRSDGRVQVLVDVVGWYSLGAPHSAHTFRALSAQRLTDRRLVGGKALEIPVAGRAGVPRSQVAGVLVSLHATGGTKAGTVQAWRGGAAVPRTAEVTYAKGQSADNVVLLPVSADGKIAVRNGSVGSTRIQMDVLGYVPADDVPTPDGTGLARYPNDLQTETGTPTTTAKADPNYSVMYNHGCTDAEGGADFVLLDIGAQSITVKDSTGHRTGLSSANPGVAIAQTGDPAVHLSYPHLVAAIEGYMDGYNDPTCNTSGGMLTLAVGTNNDGSFPGGKDPYQYAATTRGAAWANQVIDPLATWATDNVEPITVVGASDIEAQFASTEAQAQVWESTYLKNTSADLIYNGDANYCPTTFGATGKTCAYGWTEQQYYQLAHNGDRISVLPQIFFPAEAVKWANIDATGDGSVSGQLQFVGSLTEHALVPSQLSNQQARDALYRAVSSVRATPDVRYAVDIDKDS